MSVDLSHYDDYLIRLLFKPKHGGPRPHSLFRALQLGLVPGEYLEAAQAIVNGFPYPRRPSTGIPARSLYNDPSWDNVIRAYEEDR